MTGFKSLFLASMLPSFTFGFTISSRSSYQVRIFSAIWRNSAHSAVTSSSSKLAASTTKQTFATNDLNLHNGDSSPHSLSLPTVVLRRTRQSRSFRDGNPLVFTKAIKSILGSGKKDGSLGRLGLADLVHVVVESGSDGSNRKDAGFTSSEKDVSASSSRPLQKQQFQPIGIGVYNPFSLYKVRMLCQVHLQPTLYKKVMKMKMPLHNDAALRAILIHHFTIALHKRRALNLPSYVNSTLYSDSSHVIDCITNTFRLVNGEGDNLSGLAIDIIADRVAVVMSSAAWCQVHRSCIEQSLKSVLGNYETVWKTTSTRLQQDGYANDSDSREHEENLDEDYFNIEEKDPATGVDYDSEQMIVSKENGLLFHTYPFATGQKTGVYCDQRENRLFLASFCRDKRVLDLCCYHGGFAIHAAKVGGASFVTAVDSSAGALKIAEANANLNGCQDVFKFVQDDITRFMQATIADADESNSDFDVVVLDPPKLAPSAARLDKASRKYHAFNRDAIQLISRERGGLLLTCTCSASMTQRDGGQFFHNTVHGAALAAKRQVTLLTVRGAASCHVQSPIAWPAGDYLTAALFYVHPVLDLP